MELSPLDGRYKDKVEELRNYFSEFALMRDRVSLELQYFIDLIDVLEIKPESKIDTIGLEKIASEFSMDSYNAIKEIEKCTNHDVKAVEYFLKGRIQEQNLVPANLLEYIHFGLTSQDTNTTPIIYQTLKGFNILKEELGKIESTLCGQQLEWKDIPMLARTHGQPASPTYLGKEILVFHQRLAFQLEHFYVLKPYIWTTKFGGAVGNFNAHHLCFPDINWEEWANEFISINYPGLYRNPITTQIEPYDGLAILFRHIVSINVILIDLCRDIWDYISDDYFGLKINKGEIGSSTMPHKVNPINFENAEGNLGLANSLLEFMANKLPISRRQRDLTDSTVLRNVGSAFGYCLLAYKSLSTGLEKLTVNREVISKELNDNQAVLAEAIQSMMRVNNCSNPYEQLKRLTRNGKKITREELINFIKELNLPEDKKEILIKLEPKDYCGVYPTSRFNHWNY